MIIYKTTNLVNGKFYVGKDTRDDPDYFGSGIILKQAIKKYGRTSFIKETIERCDDNELNGREKYWIAKLNPPYNIAAGGEGGDTLKYASPKRKKVKARKQSESLRGKNNPFYGKTHTQENLEKMRRTNLGKVQSPDTVSKRVSARSGYTHSEETKAKMSNSHIGKTHSKEAKVKIGVASKHAWRERDVVAYKQKQSERMKLWWKTRRQVNG